MPPLLLETLDRTFLLMRDNLVPDVTDSTLLSALTSVEVALIGDARNLSSHAAQTAFVTAAMLMARSGHRVHLVAPDVQLSGQQPPLHGSHLVSALAEVGHDLLPGIEFSPGLPQQTIDLAVFFGDSARPCSARRTIGVNATAWCGRLLSARTPERWIEEEWPCGSLAAGAMVTAEAFKVAMHRLRALANDESLFDALFAFSTEIDFALAPAQSPTRAALGALDLVSAGAITNAALFVLLRLPNVTGYGQIIEPDTTHASNMNRYPLLLRSELEQSKAHLLHTVARPSLTLEPVTARYAGGAIAPNRCFYPSVLVGVDDIPTRWAVQEENPRWLGIGATSHWSAMASFHRAGYGCARCLHARDDHANDRIPTVSFVSFISGLLLACYCMRATAGERISIAEQQMYVTPLRAERIWRTPVARRIGCITCTHLAVSEIAQA